MAEGSLLKKGSGRDGAPDALLMEDAHVCTVEEVSLLLRSIGGSRRATVPTRSVPLPCFSFAIAVSARFAVSAGGGFP